MAIATINRLIILFDEAFRALSVPVPMPEVERLAILVQSAMSGKRRAFHTTKHVLHLSEGMKPTQVLAALFHDVVYCQLDGGLSAQAAGLLDGVTKSENGALLIQEIEPGDKALTLCSDIFGFTAGQILPPQRGMNEFLSAALATRILQRYLSGEQLLAVVACIEMTIPFRAPDENGQTAAQALAQRIKAHCSRRASEPPFSEQQTADFVKTLVTDAVMFANRDLSGFTAVNPGRCLSNTLLLVEESMPHFPALSFCSIQEYRGALMRMDTFLKNLNPEHVCQDYDDRPNARTLKDMTAAVKKNIAFSRDYLAALLTSMAIIEALALSTGSDCPIGLFLGDIADADGGSCEIEDLLPPVPPGQQVNAELITVFENEHILESINDLTASPLTEFVYHSLGQHGTRQALARAQLMFEGHAEPRAFLQTLDRDMLRAIIHACSKIAVSRKEALSGLAQNLHIDHPNNLEHVA